MCGVLLHVATVGLKEKSWTVLVKHVLRFLCSNRATNPDGGHPHLWGYNAPPATFFVSQGAGEDATVSTRAFTNVCLLIYSCSGLGRPMLSSVRWFVYDVFLSPPFWFGIAMMACVAIRIVVVEH